MALGGFARPFYILHSAFYIFPSVALCGFAGPFCHLPSTFCIFASPERSGRREPRAVERKSDKYPGLDAPRHRFDGGGHRPFGGLAYGR